ncbi:hypothetical protein RMN57_02370 [Kitasatospora sp. CM 4170]|uniref:Secreted protein n=1 Tax=Kitasatospora aburaviensis TaxID=67265 RepID=A0ABW1EUL9_9ACTN|nr:hypothetical protein [Kitasatospora sp. CM 4170]WNM43625.1 hypothetical protein RMN57_02370 [Kitasatospora sp. CM 4170]
MVPANAFEEPPLRIAGKRPFFLARRRFRQIVAIPFAVLVLATTGLALTGNLPFPGLPVVELRGRVASKADLFTDPEVQRILMSHRIKVTVDVAGSRQVAEGDLDPYDFVFPSGQATADTIKYRREEAHAYARIKLPFTSPLVIATYRPYAEALVRKGVAAPQGTSSAATLYYDLDLAKFLDLARTSTTWNDLGIDPGRINNDNVVAAYTSPYCDSNSAETYVSQVAFTRHGDRALDDESAAAVGEAVKPLLEAQGRPASDRFDSFVNGEDAAPTPVVYEHQYLAYQLRHKAAKGGPDTTRVLLYPDSTFLTEPRIIALKPRADKLADLIESDPELRERATELGFHVGQDAHGQDPLRTFLEAQNLPVPATANRTRALLPPPEVLETVLQTVAGCRRILS